jgi:hypothetical protein
MTSRQLKVTAELRKWRRKHIGGVLAIDGYVYNDLDEVWDDGDHALIYPILKEEEAVNHWLFSTHVRTYRCEKDEEIMNGAVSSP